MVMSLDKKIKMQFRLGTGIANIFPFYRAQLLN
jgi:hypothetical protein